MTGNIFIIVRNMTDLRDKKGIELSRVLMEELKVQTAEDLDCNVLEAEVMAKKCPLDSGILDPHRMRTMNKAGAYSCFEKLPMELRHNILTKVDIASLISFRSVNRRAMESVDSLLPFKKIINDRYCANAVRLAIGIKTADQFTIVDLFKRLCKTTCDEPTCEKLAPYIDVFTLKRRCLDVGGPCLEGLRSGPVTQEDALRMIKDPADLRSIPSFLSRPGNYGYKSSSFWSSPNNYEMHYPDFIHRHIEWLDRVPFYDSESLERLPGTIPMLRKFGSVHLQKLSSVFAPWLNANSNKADYGFLCPVCADLSKKDELWDDGIDDFDVGNYGNGFDDAGARSLAPRPPFAAFCSEEGWASHMIQEHGKDRQIFDVWHFGKVVVEF